MSRILLALIFPDTVSAAASSVVVPIPRDIFNVSPYNSGLFVAEYTVNLSARVLATIFGFFPINVQLLPVLPYPALSPIAVTYDPVF